MVDNASKKIFIIDNGLTLGEFHQSYRNEPHEQLENHGHLKIEPDIMKLITPEAKARAIAALKKTGMNDKVCERVGRRFDYVINHGELPQFGREVK
jgi:hypothetical protein